MRIRWSGQANRDLNAIFDYLSERSPRGVRTVLSRVEKRVASLRENPLLGPAAFDTGARSWLSLEQTMSSTIQWISRR